ncbi:MAG: hypothetical protein EU549_03515 [Promethearchaeota archaeon]|nr:MAG: hypothetical protein EU549_03515 [Candidatus Lokiarchaeota archaeon]
MSSKKLRQKEFSILFISLLAVVSIFSGLNYVFQSGNYDDRVIKKTQKFKTAYYNNSANPIYIDGNAGGVGAHNWTWAADQPWCSGSGTWVDPYIIANIAIDGQNLNSCIRIEYSDVFFQIENSTFYNSSRGYFPSYKAGIELKSVTNGFIHNSTFSANNGFGISLWNCENNTIINNKMIEDDIWTQGADLNYILENKFFSVDHGISLDHGSTYNVIARNWFFDCNDGIDLTDDNNEIVNNTFSNCEIGIIGYNANNNTISNNTILNGNSMGISFQSSSNNTIIYNKVINGTFSFAVRCFDFSDFNNISFNIITNNSAKYESGCHGIHIGSGQNNTIYNNTINYNEGYGINLIESNYTIVLNNLLIENVEGCINEVNCIGTVINNNICIELPGNGDGEEPLIFGYDIFILLGLVSIISLIVVKKIKKAK